MNRSKLFQILLGLIMAFIATTSFAQKPAKTVDVVTWPYGAWAPCGNGGSGEMIWGALDIRITRFVRANGWHDIYLPLGGNLAGVVSGENFKAVGAATNHFNLSGDGGNSSEVWINHYIGDRGTKLKVFHKIHWTVNAKGDTTVDFDHSVVDCKCK